jgi:small subunit ribosomal protein S5
MADANTPAPVATDTRPPRRDGGNRGPRRDGRGPVVEEKKEFDERIVHIDRVARVVKGGRRFRFRALVVVGDHKGKVGGARILIKPASAGTGLIAGGVVRTILEVTGVSNVLSKSLGSTNKANTAYATIQALQSLEPAKNWVTTKSAPKVAAAKKADAKETK